MYFNFVFLYFKIISVLELYIFIVLFFYDLFSVFFLLVYIYRPIPFLNNIK